MFKEKDMLGPANNYKPDIQSHNSLSSLNRVNNSAVLRLSSNTKTVSSEKSDRSYAGMQPRKTVEQLKKELSGLHDVTIQFSIHEATGKTMVKIVDKESNEVIREIPSEEDLERSERLQIYVGQLFDAVA